MRQHAGFNGDGANLVECAAVRADAVLAYLFAEDALAQSFSSVWPASSWLRAARLGSSFQLSGQLVLDLLDESVALGLGDGLGVERVRDGRQPWRKRVVVGLIEFRSSDGTLWLAGLGARSSMAATIF